MRLDMIPYYNLGLNTKELDRSRPIRVDGSIARYAILCDIV